MEKIKILHLQLFPLLSGVQNMMIQLLSALNQEKYDIFVVSRSDGPLVKKVIENNWTHIPLDTLVRNLSFSDFKSAWKFYKILKDIKPDIVHTHSSKTGFIGRIVAKIAKVPLIIHTAHGFSFHPYQKPITRIFYSILESFASFFADYNIFVNIFEKELAIHKLGFNQDKTMTIYNGVKPYHKQKQYPEDFLSNDTLKIISVLRFSEQKNIVSTIEQAIKVVKKIDNVTFTFLGDGELLEVCKNIINSNSVQDKIILGGWSFNVLDTLLEYDVFLLNSLWEGLPISILEAMSVGLPVICSNIKGNNELVDDSNGWLTEIYDLNALEKVVLEILADKNILVQKGRESLKKVTTLFHEEFFINEYQKLYEMRK